MVYCRDCKRDYSNKSYDRHILTKSHLNKAYRFKHIYNVKNILVSDVDDALDDIIDEYTQMFHSFEMVYQFGDIKKSFKYENRNSLSKYYNRNDLINITFNFYSNVIDMSFNYYIKMPKSMLETTLIKTLDRYPEKLKIFEHNWMPYYNYLTLKYFGVIKKDVDGFIINYYLDNDWRENPPLTPNEEKKRF